MTSLYGLAQEITLLELLIETAYEQTQAPPDATPEQIAELEEQRRGVDDALMQQLEDHSIAVVQKVDGYCSILQEIRLRREAREAEAKRIQALANADETVEKRLKGLLQRYMEASRQDKIAGVRFSVALQLNGGKAPLVVRDGIADNLDLVPERFVRTKLELNAEALRTALEAEDEGALEIACLAPRGKHVRIR